MRCRFRAAGVYERIIACVTVITVVASTAAGKTIVRLDGWDKAVHDSLEHPTADPSAFFEVIPGSTWETVLGTCEFRSGTLAFFSPVGGRPTGCLFRGEGTFSYAPPSPIERGQLRRFCGDSALATSCDRIYFRFFDSTVAAGLDACRGAAARGDLPSGFALRSDDHQANADLAMNLATRGWQGLIDSVATAGFLYACPRLEGQHRLHFLWDETQEEAITVWRRPRGPQERGAIDLVCSYDHVRPTRELMYRRGILHGGFDVEHYTSDVRIAPSTEVSLDVRLTATMRRHGVAALSFILAPDLEIDTIWVAGARAPFVYDDFAGWLVVRAPESYASAGTVVVHLAYRGRHLLYKLPWGDFYISHTTRWLPKETSNRRTPYETTFQFPKHYDLVSCGQQTLDSTDKDRRISRWRTYDPAVFISFNYGAFDHLSEHVSGGPRLDIYRSVNHPMGILGGDMKKAVAAHIHGAVELFTRAFGPYPWDHLAATEIPSAHGQGFPQLLHLGWPTFETTREWEIRAFIAHEVAHQWFGHLVGWETYHDQWLSEGFAEYAAGLYVQALDGRNHHFFDQLKAWRDQILQSGGHDAWHAGPRVAPIWLGFRCASESSPASYSRLVYAKGAYVLHMLRQMLHDYRTGSDERFFAMMRDYVGRFARTNASTADFQQVVEQHIGMPMQWFFDQWVYGVQIPRFEYGWRRERTADGHYVVTGQIDQFDCDSSFRCFMPITFACASQRSTMLQEVIGRHTRFVSPPLEQEPRDVVFNDYLAVLGRGKIVKKP